MTLLWRAFWLIAALMLLALGAWLSLFSEAEQERRARHLAQMITSITNLTRVALIASRPEHRALLLAELSDREGVRVYPADPDDQIEPPPPHGLTERMQAILQQSLGDDARLAFAVNGEEGLYVRFHIFEGSGGDFWLALPRQRLERHFPLQWLGWGAAVLLLALAGAWLIVFRITRPLRDLESAARSLGDGGAPAPLPVRGPPEIVAVNHAFNNMRDNLRQLEEDRALLLAGVSHDLRTPLTRLRMETEMSVADAAARAGMEADIAEMDHIIGQFLDFARPPATRFDDGEETDVIALLNEIAARHGDRILRCDKGDAGGMRPGMDAASLRRAVVNLVENALRHGGASAAEPLQLGCELTADELIISVMDRGPGMSPQDTLRLQQPFTRGEKARTSSGAGLGLAIVNRIAASGGGVLELSPRPGGGLLARLRLPRCSSAGQGNRMSLTEDREAEHGRNRR